MSKKRARYCKFIYWFEEGPPPPVKEHLERAGYRLYQARERPCEILFRRRNACLCAPEVWSRACKRQGSWYRESDRAGRYLMAFNDPLPEELGGPICRIVKEKFHPPGKASREDAEALIQQPEFQKKVPKGWDAFDPEEKKTLAAYLASQRVSMPLEDVFLFYSANHANFIRPAFFVEEKGAKVPFSIEDTPLLCSACVELFGLLGSAFQKKYIRKCPGLYYVDMAPDEFFMVEHA